MEISYLEFTVLTYIDAHQDIKQTQRKMAESFDCSVGKVNLIINDLLEKKLLTKIATSKYEVTALGYESLEPYKVKRVVFIAAGFGSRMVPVTLNTPKPLVLVHGKRFIETLLDAVVAKGIEDIYIVRGYLGENFDLLLKKYPNIKFIDNPLYNEANNISSAYLVKDLLQNTYVMEGDLFLSNPDLIRKYEYESNYLGVKVENTDDWCFETGSHKLISKVKIGGEDVYQMIGISFWTTEDGKKLSKHIEKSFKEYGGKEKYWDVVALKDYQKEYNVYVRPCKREDIIEIDTFSELKAFDKIYDV